MENKLKIKALRCYLETNQDDFARIIGVSPRTVQGWEGGKNVGKWGMLLLDICAKQHGFSFASITDNYPVNGFAAAYDAADNYRIPTLTPM